MRKRRASSRELAYGAAKRCSEKKAANVVILDMRKLNFVTDFFVICTIMTSRQIGAVRLELIKYFRDKNRTLIGGESPSEEWAVLDFGDVVCHCMTKQKRDFYNLESLWFDAPLIKYKGGGRR